MYEYLFSFRCWSLRFQTYKAGIYVEDWVRLASEAWRGAISFCYISCLIFDFLTLKRNNQCLVSKAHLKNKLIYLFYEQYHYCKFCFQILLSQKALIYYILNKILHYFIHNCHTVRISISTIFIFVNKKKVSINRLNGDVMKISN